MQPLSSHILLVHSTSCEGACDQVATFFHNTLLVRYDKTEIVRNQCLSAKNENFHTTLQEGVEANRNALKHFFSELRGTGFENAEDLLTVEHGYPSKLLHVITHFLDGFIGIDTKFYNLLDDSHWVPETTLKAIQSEPDSHWLITVKGYSDSPETASLIQM